MAALATPATARAQNADEGAAESLFQAGKSLLEQKNYEQACPKLSESYRLDPGTGTLLALALCHEGEGRLATAWGEFAEVAARARREHRPDREDSRASTRRRSSLPCRCSLLRSRRASRGSSTSRSSATASRWAPVRGPRRFQSYPGPSPHRGLGARLQAVRHDCDHRVGRRLPVGRRAGPRARARRKRPGRAARRRAKAAAVRRIATAGVGVVGVVVGTIFGLRAIQPERRLEGGLRRAEQLRSGELLVAYRLALGGNVSTVAFIAGGALLAAGATMIVVSRPRGRAPPRCEPGRWSGIGNGASSSRGRSDGVATAGPASRGARPSAALLSRLLRVQRDDRGRRAQGEEARLDGVRAQLRLPRGSRRRVHLPRLQPPLPRRRRCADGARCLQTQGGTACVANAVASCDASRPCPGGFSCIGGVCRDACGSPGQCLGDQTCAGGACLGTSARHDRSPDAGGADAGLGEPPDASEPVEAAADGPGEAAPAPCVLDARQCNGLQPQRCAANGWVNDGAACTFACGATGCQGVCATNDHQCSPDGLGVETCGADGQWGPPQPCAFVCSGGACGGHCTPGGKQCSVTVPQSCGSDGEWASGTACPERLLERRPRGRVHAERQAVQQPRSRDLRRQRRVGRFDGVPVRLRERRLHGRLHSQRHPVHEWRRADVRGERPVGTASPCNYVCSGKVCGGVCTPNDTLCPNDTQKQVCGADGTWGTATTCPYACVGKTCGGSCVPGAKQCNVNTVQSCDTTGTWIDQTACSGGTPSRRSNQCVASASYDDGNSSQLTDPDTESPGYMTVVEITVNYRTSLLRFGMFGRAATTNGNVVMVIYGESTSAPGTPGPLVMSSTPMAVASGRLEPLPAQATNLAPGHYWIGAVFQATADTWWSMSGGPTALYFNDTYPNTPMNFPTTGVTSLRDTRTTTTSSCRTTERGATERGTTEYGITEPGGFRSTTFENGEMMNRDRTRLPARRRPIGRSLLAAGTAALAAMTFARGALADTYECIPSAVGVFGLDGPPNWFNAAGGTANPIHQALDDPRWNGFDARRLAAVRGRSDARRGVSRAPGRVEALSHVPGHRRSERDDRGLRRRVPRLRIDHRGDGEAGDIVLNADNVQDTTDFVSTAWRHAGAAWSGAPVPAWVSNVAVWAGTGTAPVGAAWAINVTIDLATLHGDTDIGGGVTSNARLFYAIDVNTHVAPPPPSRRPWCGRREPRSPFPRACSAASMDPTLWGQSVIGITDPSCPSGISITPESIGTMPIASNGVPSSTVTYGGTAATANTFVAVMTNPPAAGAVKADFRLADWGSQIGDSSADWKSILAARRDDAGERQLFGAPRADHAGSATT